MQRKVKARYRTVGPKIEKVTYKLHSIDEETKSLQEQEVTEEMKTWMVYFPAGHSIRFCGERGWKELVKLGFHLRPRMIDMDTGDVVDVGGDPYDFGPAEEISGIVLDDSEEGDQTPTRKKG